jgi:hypothetical protein
MSKVTSFYNLQAVQTQAIPDIELPTDEHLKRYPKKKAKPDRSLAIAATKASKRYREQRTHKD